MKIVQADRNGKLLSLKSCKCLYLGEFPELLDAPRRGESPNLQMPPYQS